MKRNIAILLLGFAFFAGIGLTVVWQKIKLSQEKGKLTVVARSKPPGIIIGAFMAKAIEPTTGKPTVLTNAFSPEDNDLYLVVAFGKVQPQTRIEFVRYRNSKYLDHGSIQVKSAHAKYGTINWTSHPPLGNRPKGTYLIKVYTNGRLEKITQYTVS